MIKTLAKSIREYKRASILTPLFVSLEVIIECFIPFITAKLITVIELGEGGFRAVIPYGIVLVVLAALSLTFGALAGHYCAVASCGFAKNLRHDMYYAVQDYSFANIDKFSSSSLVTRMTTDVSNVQIRARIVRLS